MPIAFCLVQNRVFDVELVHKDDVLNCLMEGDKEGKEFWDEMTEQCLELMLNGFVVVTKRLLFDHFECGVKECDAELRRESRSISLTNAQPEEDFDMLDYLTKSRPKASTIAVEGLIMCMNNNLSTWHEKLIPEKRSMVMEMARKSKKSQREKYF